MKKAVIKAVASYLPEQVLTNDALAKAFPEWSVDKIYSKTGIHSRHIAAPDEAVSDMAIVAARTLFQDSGVEPEDIDFILLCTQSPDYPLPTTACVIQAKLGCRHDVGALDLIW